MTRKLFSLFLSALLMPTLSACAATVEYSAEPIEARVVDAETKQPLEGVIVVAHWQLHGGLHPANAGELTILETLTDKAGRFYFPAWGPKPLPAKAPSNARLLNDDPQLLLFKPNYKYKRLNNPLDPSWRKTGEPLRRSQWNGKTIKMERFKGTVEEYAKTLSSLSISLRFAYDNENCEMRFVPRMMIALYLEEKRFREAKVYSSLHSMNHELNDSTYQDKCGIRPILRSYLP